MYMRTRYLLLSVIILVTGLTAAPAFAHKVNMFAYPEGNEIFIEGYFSDGKRPMHSEVKVFDSAGKELLSGLTNEEGQFSFVIPKDDDLRITLNAGQGHRTEYTLSRAELAGEVETAQQQVASEGETENGLPGQQSGSIEASPELQATIQRAVGESIRPVMRGLSELTEKSRFSDIIGGIGFIVGIIGIFFYVKARKLMNTNKDGAEKS